MYTNQEQELRTIPRTLCVGIGGTGYKVLGQVRKLLVEQYGSPENFPIVSFVHLDTDTAAPPVMGGTNYYRGVDLSFKDAERVRTYVSQPQIREFLQELKASDRPERDPNNPFKHIAQWFPRELNENIPALEHGAAGIRAVGRLAFFFDYMKFEKALRSAVAQIQNPEHEEKLLNNWNLQVHPKLHITVVCSLCGGTGSGMFLDVAYTLRRLYPEAVTTAYLVIAPELYGGNLRQRANTYAALKELNYYTTPGSVFEACYNHEEGIFIDRSYQGIKRPFDYTFLVGNGTDQDICVIQSQDKLCTIIANKIACEYHSELGPGLRSRRVDFTNDLISFDSHPRKNIESYLAFGLSAIYFPQDDINQGVLNKIGIELLNFWIEGEQNPRPQQTLQNFLAKYQWGTQSGLETAGFEDVLLSVPLENNATFTTLLQQRRNQLRNRIEDCNNQDERGAVVSALEQASSDLLYKTLSGDISTQRGNWVRKLQEQRQELIQKLKTAIAEFLSQLLNSATDEFGIQNARNWLDALNQSLSDYEYSATSKVKEGQSFSQEDLTQRWEGLRKRLKEIEKEFHLWGGNSKKNSKFQEEANRTLSEAFSRIEASFKSTIMQENLQIVVTLRPYVQQTIQAMTGLHSLVNHLKKRAVQQQEQVVTQKQTQMNGLAIVDDNDVDFCYRQILPLDDRRNIMAQLTARVIRSFGEEPSLTQLLDKDEQLLARSLQDQIRLVVDQQFSSSTTAALGSVIKRFYSKYPGNQAIPRLENVHNQSLPLLKINQLAGVILNEQNRRRWIAFMNSNEFEVQEFRSVLTNGLNIPPSDFISTSSESKILFVREIAGFPLRLLNEIEFLRDQYLIAKNQGSTLHNHRDEDSLFFDIIPPERQQQEGLLKLLIQSLAIQVIESVEGSDRKGEEITKFLIFKDYNDFLEEDEEYYFSPSWDMATEQIYKDGNLQKKLRTSFAEVFSQMKQSPDSCWPLLQKFYKKVDGLKDKREDVNFRYREKALQIIEEMKSSLVSTGKMLPPESRGKKLSNNDQGFKALPQKASEEGKKSASGNEQDVTTVPFEDINQDKIKDFWV